MMDVDKNTKKKTICLVEDDDILRKTLSEALSDAGFSVSVATNGDEGFSLIEKERPALVLLDLLMPVMNGIELLKKIRQEEWGKNLRIVMLTNVDAIESLASVMEKGVTDYLIKSDWKISDLVENIKSRFHSV